MNRTLCWAPEAWEQYLYWQRTDAKILAKINTLLRECARTPFAGTGKPEPLKGNAYKGYWSRRITQELPLDLQSRRRQLAHRTMRRALRR
ncbi:Txe/YoeB family addiction module toxin [Hymenobacter convexus]|uniref:Txe/YoeB family addiction module toxin n=1 Tax=Hymenobacter sp. CA1UV-4 TaxID=3063782 RepID=UPI00350EF410